MAPMNDHNEDEDTNGGSVQNIYERLRELEEQNRRIQEQMIALMTPMLNSLCQVIAHGFDQTNIAAQRAQQQLAAQNEQQHRHLMACWDRMDMICSSVDRLGLKANNLEQRLIDVEKHQAEGERRNEKIND